MHVIERPLPQAMHTTAMGPALHAAANTNDAEVMLEPLTRPELGAIRLDGPVLAIGRNEAPFASFPPEILVMLSRRHARLFREHGALYVADLDSSNGTTVNRVPVNGKPRALRDGDELGFGGVLAYRVRIDAHTLVPRPAPLTLELSPANTDTELQPVTIARFPFLVSKSEATFARYRATHAQQLDYLSRRQAHIFQKGGEVYIEDLGSTNGTFVDGQRLDEHAVPLRDGARLAFGGEHFVYRVAVRRPAAVDDAATQLRGDPAPAAAPTAADAQPAPLPAPANAGKTTFVAAPDSFLDIFCVDTQQPEDQPAEAAAASSGGQALAPVPASAPKAVRRGRVATRLVTFVSELATTIADGRRDRLRSSLMYGAALVAGACAIIVTLAVWTTTQGELKALLERGDVAAALRVADEALRRSPDDAEIRALATEAALKTHVPAWLGRIAGHDFDAARAALAALTALGARNPELPPLAAELAWLGDLQQLMHTRGGPDQPIRIYADEERIAGVLERWNRGTGEHQRALARVASYVPEFAQPYADALTQLRKLQSEATVVLAAIERLKSSVAAELGRDRPDALEPMLKEYAERYPNLGGLDALRADLQRLLALRGARARQDRLLALMASARFATPPFQQALRSMSASGQLPPEALVREVGAATDAWRRGETEPAQAALQRLADDPQRAGAWSVALTREIERRRGVLARFAALQAARGMPAYVEQLLAFRESLEADEDQHYLRATDADVAQQKARIVERAEALLGKARGLWQDYRSAGAIDAAQRIEITVSGNFRTRAKLLADAHRAAGQGQKILASLPAQPGSADAGAWAAITQEIRGEMQLQRNALQDLRNVLEPELLKSKLALLGDATE
ncbi:MAG: FHA domain-containing protein [Burkholderiaceae bacterium]